MAKVSSKLGAQESIEIINSITSEEELLAFVDDAEERKTVLAASDARYAQLTEAGSADENEDPEETADQDEVETEETTEEESEDEDEDPEEIVTDELVTPEFLADAAEAVENKVNAEKKFKSQNVDHTVTELQEAHEAFEKSIEFDEETDTVGFSEEKFDEFCKAVANQANADKQRRGLMSPSKVDAALKNLHETLNG